METDTSATRVLVTGGTGFVGGHVIVRLLQAGYQVRTTVRSPDSADQVRALVETGGADPAGVEVVVADLSADAGWDDATEGVRFVQHVASPFPNRAPQDDDEVIRPAREGAVRVLAASARAGVERVVLTSSFAAVGYSAARRPIYTEADWTAVDDPNTAYIRSKVLAERAAWDFVADHGKPELCVVNPVGIFGPALGPKLSTSVAFVDAMLSGRLPAVPRQYFGVVDVRDVADLQVRAMTSDEAAGERFLAVSGESMSFFEMARILATALGDAASAVPSVELTDDEVREAARTDPALRESLSQLGRKPVISNEKARSVLGWRPRDAGTTIVDTAQSLLSLRAGRRS